jgi:hypothetical protein
VDFTSRSDLSSTICNIEAYGNLRSPFCAFAVRAMTQQESVEQTSESSFRLVQKYCWPIGEFSFNPK